MKTEEKKKKKKHRSEEALDGNGSSDGLNAEIHHLGDIKAKRHKVKNSLYETELALLQIELVKLQEWVKHEKLKVVLIFEGRADFV